MRALLTPLASALIAGWLIVGSAPGKLAHAGSRPEIKITASVDTTAPEQQPILVVHLLNQSGHELRMPDPPLLCKPAPGALSLMARFYPSKKGKAQNPTHCSLQVDGTTLPDIRERAKKWITVEPDQNYVVRRPLAMGMDATATGTYKFRVVYTSPAATDSDQEKLKEAGIVAPEGRFRSRLITYRVKLPKP